MTPAEASLWSWLKTLRGRGFHFRRQTPFRGYYLDFVCFSRRLVIELDGEGHSYTGEHDRVRDAVLRREGFLVIRMENQALRDDPAGVTDGVLAILQSRPAVEPGTDVKQNCRAPPGPLRGRPSP
jgi:very-short-patch-repair endonuclease